MYLFGLPDENHIVSIFLLSFICWVQNRLWVRKKQANSFFCSPVSFFCNGVGRAPVRIRMSMECCAGAGSAYTIGKEWPLIFL